MPKTVSGALLLLPLLALPPAPPVESARGPAAILGLHKVLLRVLDAGDVEGATSLLETASRFKPSLFIADGEGRPVTARGPEAVRLAVARLAGRSTETRGARESRITRIIDASCHSPELGFCVVEFTRLRTVNGRKVVERYRSTLLVSYRDGRWRFFHWHLSPAGGGDTRRV